MMLLRALIPILMLSSVANAKPSDRFALLIGNKNYQLDALDLKNPHNDVAHVGNALRKIGFQVRTVLDAGIGDLIKEVNRYSRNLKSAGSNAIGFFYYSGHGAMNEHDRHNYLIPSDVKTVDDVELWDSSLRLHRIIEDLRDQAGNATHFVVFDACRNELKLKNEIAKSLARPKGFRPIQQVRGMLIAYATAEGEFASDDGARAGPYARALASELATAGIEAVTVFRRVQIAVFEQIGQEPWYTHGAIRQIYLGGNLPDNGLSESPLAQSPIPHVASLPIPGLDVTPLNPSTFHARASLVPLRRGPGNVFQALDVAKADDALNVTGFAEIDDHVWYQVTLDDGSILFVDGALVFSKSVQESWAKDTDNLKRNYERSKTENSGQFGSRSGIYGLNPNACSENDGFPGNKFLFWFAGNKLYWSAFQSPEVIIKSHLKYLRTFRSTTHGIFKFYKTIDNTFEPYTDVTGSPNVIAFNNKDSGIGYHVKFNSKNQPSSPELTKCKEPDAFLEAYIRKYKERLPSRYLTENSP